MYGDRDSPAGAVGLAPDAIHLPLGAAQNQAVLERRGSTYRYGSCFMGRVRCLPERVDTMERVN